MSARTPGVDSVQRRGGHDSGQAPPTPRGAQRTQGASHGAARAVRAAREGALLVVRTVLWVGFTAAGVALNTWVAVTLLLLLTPQHPLSYVAIMLGAAVGGCLGGAAIGLGQVLALRRWLDGAASLGSFLSAVLASCAALSLGTTVGWWVYTVAGDLIGGLAGLVIYGSVFGVLQRPMLDYLTRHSLLWVPTNAIAALLGALAMIAGFGISGGSRDTLQFRYVGLVYALVTGIAFLWLTHEVRRALAADRELPDASAFPVFPSSPLPGASAGAEHPDYDPDVLEIHEHRIYRVHRVPGKTVDPKARTSGSPGNTGDPGIPSSRGNRPHEAWGSRQVDAIDVIDGTFRVLP